MTLSLIVASIASCIGCFILGIAFGRKPDRTSKTVITWRDGNGNAFKELTFYGEYEKAPWTANLPTDYHSVYFNESDRAS